MRRPTQGILRKYRLNGPRRRFFSQEQLPHTSPRTNNTASKVPLNQSSTEAVDNANVQGRLDRLLKRSPRFIHRHILALRSAPITHISAFLILHEITAVVPLIGLAGAFHYYNWLPSYFSEGAWVISGVERFGRYFRRKGWISADEEREAEKLTEQGDAHKVEENETPIASRVWTKGEGGVRLVVEFATAYAIVKVLLIPRLVLSAWAAPWFARWTVVPTLNLFRRIFKRGPGIAKNV